MSQPQTPLSIAQQLHTSLSQTQTPLPTLTWLQTLASSRNPPPSLSSLLATARMRLLNSDLTTPNLLDARWKAQHSLPANLAQGYIDKREGRLGREVVVQVVDIEDVSRPRWEQVEELEAEARGEYTKGREVVRLPLTPPGTEEDDVDTGVAEDDEFESQGPPSRGAVATNGTTGTAQQKSQKSDKNSTHKLVLQDCSGQKVYALELKRVPQLGVGRTPIGEKILLKATTLVARGVVLLEPANVVILGGKVDAWHRAWCETRVRRLREAVGAPPGDERGRRGYRGL